MMSKNCKNMKCRILGYQENWSNMATNLIYFTYK